MADIQLNKPLYKANPSPAEKTLLERPAKPLLWARIGALILDIMVLHALLVGLIKIVPQATVRLGYAGPWVGFALGILYFGIGYSGLVRGRTLGKLVLRMQVLGVDGPDLSLGRGILRAFLTYWPLAVLTVLRAIAEKNTTHTDLTLAPMIPVIGAGITGGWLIGNFAHALADPFGRTFIDRVSKSNVISTEATPAVLQTYLVNLREFSDPTRIRYASIYLLSSMVALIALAGFNVFVTGRSIRTMPAEERQLMLNYMAEHNVPGFGQPLPPALVAQGQQARTRLSNSPKTEDTTTAIFLYTRRSPVDLEELKANPAVTSAVDRIVTFTQNHFAKSIAEGKQAQMPSDKMKFRTTFAEFSDLLFAWNSNPVYEVEKMAEFRAPTPSAARETTGPVAIEDITTATAAAVDTITSSTANTSETTSSTAAP